MIKYRPHRGSLGDAMAEYKEFNNISDMFKHIKKYWGYAIRLEDLSISESYGEDKRINWTSYRYILTRQWGDEVYDIPQCIGFCDLGEVEPATQSNNIFAVPDDPNEEILHFRVKSIDFIKGEVNYEKFDEKKETKQKTSSKSIVMTDIRVTMDQAAEAAVDVIKMMKKIK